MEITADLCCEPADLCGWNRQQSSSSEITSRAEQAQTSPNTDHMDIEPRPDECLCTSDNELEGLRSDFGTESEEESSGSDNEDSGEESSGSDNEDPGDEHPAGSSRAQNHAVGSPLHSTVCSTGERKKTDAPPRSFDSQRAAEEWFSRESSLAFLIEKYAGAHKLIGFFWVRMRVHISSLGSFACVCRFLSSLTTYCFLQLRSGN